MSFEKNGVSYVAAWSNICECYEEKLQSTKGMTKIIHIAVYPKPL